MRELRSSAFIGLPQFDSDPRPRLVGELPCHGQPVRRLRLGNLAARQLSLAMVDNQPSPVLMSISTTVPSHRDSSAGSVSPRQTAAMGAWNDHDTVTAPSLSASAESDMDLSMPVPTVDPKGTGPSDFLTASTLGRTLAHAAALAAARISAPNRHSRTANLLVTVSTQSRNPNREPTRVLGGGLHNRHGPQAACAAARSRRVRRQRSCHCGRENVARSTCAAPT